MSEHRNYRRTFNTWLRSGARVREDTDAEIESHLQMRVDDLVRSGMSIDDARREAEQKFGRLSDARRELYRGAEARNRQLRRRDRLSGVLADLRFALRQARKSPGMTALAIVVIGIGIGMTTTTLTLMERILLRPLPFPADHELISLGSVDSLHNGFPRVSSSNWREWTTGSTSLAATALHMQRDLAVMTDEGAVNVAAQVVTGGFLTTLRPRLALGRAFDSTETATEAQVAVVSERFWRQMLHADSTLSQPIRGVAQSYRVIGVLAEGQEYPATTDVWIPTRANDPGPNNINWGAIARIDPNTSLDKVRAELDARAAEVRRNTPDALYSWGVDVKPLKSLLVGEASNYLTMLVLGAALVFLIACANIAATNLGRASARAREFAVRAAIGAGRGRLIQQLLIEHLALGIIAGIVGVLLATLSLRVMIARWGAEIPRVAEVSLDPVVLVATLVLATLAGVMTGVLPAIMSSRISLSTLMATGGHGSTHGGRGMPTSALVVAQISTAVVLATGSTLLLRSFDQLTSRSLGFSTNVVAAQIELSGARYEKDNIAVMTYWSTLSRELASIPGVRAVGLTNRAPLLSGGYGFIELEHAQFPGASAGYRVVSGDYFGAIGMPLLSGRTFANSDVEGGERVAVINDAMARKYWPGTDPIGQRVRALSMEGWFTRNQPQWIRIVGIVGDVRHHGFDDDIVPEMFVHYVQVPLWTRGMTAIVAPSTSAAAIADAVRSTARRVDRSVTVQVSTLADRLSDELAERTMVASLVSVYGTVAVLLAALGVYGMLAYAVARRMRELAVRAALGADRWNILGLVLSNAGRVAGIGIGAGIAGSFALTRLLESQLVDVAPTDPLSMVLGAGVLGVVAIVASLPPALRAARVSPLVVLRED